jgi:hypothetical protein
VVEDLVWKGNIDLAMDYQRAEKTPTITTSTSRPLHVMVAGGTRRGRIQPRVQDDVVTTNNWRAEYALDRFLTDKWFWQGRLNYKRDNVEELSRQRVVGTGPGYQFWDDELGAFSLGSLLNRTDYEYSDGGKDNFYSVAMKWDYNRYLIGKKVEFFTNGELGKPLSGVANYALDAEMGLRYKVTDWASLNLKAERDIISGTKDADLNKTRYRRVWRGLVRLKNRSLGCVFYAWKTDTHKKAPLLRAGLFSKEVQVR